MKQRRGRRVWEQDVDFVCYMFAEQTTYLVKLATLPVHHRNDNVWPIPRNHFGARGGRGCCVLLLASFGDLNEAINMFKMIGMPSRSGTMTVLRAKR